MLLEHDDNAYLKYLVDSEFSVLILSLNLCRYCNNFYINDVFKIAAMLWSSNQNVFRASFKQLSWNMMEMQFCTNSRRGPPITCKPVNIAKKMKNLSHTTEVIFHLGSLHQITDRMFLCFSHGLCGHRTSGNSMQFRKPLIVAYYDVDYVKNTKGTNYWRNR